MIKSLVVLSFALVSFTASAAEQIQLPANVIAQVRTAGGFTPVPMEQGVRVFADGTVVSFNSRANPQQVLIARLTPLKVQQLRASADRLRLSRLVSLDGNGPGCMDAPSTEYALNTTRAGGMVVARTIDCKRFGDVNAGDLTEVLKGLQALAQVSGQF